MQELALKPLDTFGCNNEQNAILIMSSRDLEGCIFWQKKKYYICHQREIISHTAPNPCKSMQLQGTLAIELEPNTILLKTEEKEITINCRKNNVLVKTSHKIEGNFSKINLGTNCEILGKDVKICSYTPNSI